MRYRLCTSNAGETAALGEALGSACSGRLALLLAGEYGSGKTTLIQGLARGLGITGAVRSPSYNILRVYAGGRLPLVHADLYRTHSLADIEELGILDLLPDPGVLAVEWPGRLTEAGTGLPEIRIQFEYPQPQGVQPDCGASTRLLEIQLDEICPSSVREVVIAAAAG